MAEHPIIFSVPKLRYTLGLPPGQPFQTRRVIRPQPPVTSGLSRFGHEFSVCGRDYRCPYGAPGDRAWVRETFYCDHRGFPDAPIEEMRELLYYRAEHGIEGRGRGFDNCWTGFSGETMRVPWSSSIHMPRWASRLTLEVTEVRVQRLHEISEEDAEAEGVERDRHGWRDYLRPGDLPQATAADSFCTLWDSINAKRSPWARNDWVWALTLRVAEVKRA